jgi:predicted aspartyl protease
MNSFRYKFALISMSILTVFGLDAQSQQFKSAEKLFKAGQFIQAQDEFYQVLKKRPDHAKANIYMGYISLLSNKLDDAERWLAGVLRREGKNSPAHEFMAEVHYRRLDFERAARVYKTLGRKSIAQKLMSFEQQTPYEIEENFSETSIGFTVAEPLPFVSVMVNGVRHGNFIIDTGGAELMLDTDFANEVGAETFGTESGNSFGGGKEAALVHGKVLSVDVGTLKVKHLPVTIMPLRQIELAGLAIDGVIGTVFLYQFLATIDYKNGQLVLRNKAKFKSEQLSFNEKAVEIQFALAEDHFMVSQGTIENSQPMLFFVDTGLSGAAFTCPKSTLRTLKIDLNKKETGIGAGGTHTIYPFELSKLCLGNICKENLPGLYGPFPPSLQHSFGFEIKGLISHEFFKGSMLTLDFQEMKLFMEK